MRASYTAPKAQAERRVAWRATPEAAATRPKAAQKRQKAFERLGHGPMDTTNRRDSAAEHRNSEYLAQVSNLPDIVRKLAPGMSMRMPGCLY